MQVEIDWGAGFIRHHIANVTRLGAGYRLTLLMPKRIAPSGYPVLRVRIGGREALEVRIESMEPDQGETRLTLVAIMPASVTHTASLRPRASKRPSRRPSKGPPRRAH